MQKIKFEYRITAGYLIIGGLWIIFSDKILNYFISDALVLTRIQTFKGWFYVLITAILFYSLLKRHLAKIREAEHKAKESDRLKTAFLQNISHEIRTPMNSIVGFADLLKEDHLSDDEKREYLSHITKGSDQLLNIVNKILDISIIDAGNVSINQTYVNLNKLLDEIYSSFKPLINTNISFSVIKGLSDPKSTILTDVSRLRLVLNNLVSNAVKFTDTGYIKFGYTLVNKELEFFIEDTGIGIDEKYHENIFNRFSKLEPGSSRFYEGLGLGLAISKGNIEMLNGRLWIKSEAGKGSVFFFTIPYKPADSQHIPQSESSDHDSIISKNTILVAEDDETNFLYIKEIFKGTDAEILHAANGKEAVDLCQSNKKINMVLIDIKMPVMNGYEAIKEIRQLRPEIPIIAQTAYALSNDMVRAFNAGSNDYISKPFTKEELLKIIAKYQ